MERNDRDWFADEAFWQATFPFMFPEARLAAAVEEVRKVAALAGVAGGKVLDLACGPGRHAVRFAQAGYEVTGVDRTGFLLEKARALADRERTAVEWVRQDMREFVRPGTFDLAVNLFTSFGYFEAAADNRRVLENVFASLKPGGTFVFDHLGKEILAGRFQPTISETLADGTLIVQRNTVVQDWSRIEGEWIIIRDDRVSRFVIRHWLHSGQEIRELLTAVGFADVALFGGLDGSPYGPQAQRLVAVARKPQPA